MQRNITSNISPRILVVIVGWAAPVLSARRDWWQTPNNQITCQSILISITMTMAMMVRLNQTWLMKRVVHMPT
jgi:hypothetical protein